MNEQILKELLKSGMSVGMANAKEARFHLLIDQNKLKKQRGQAPQA